MFLSARMRDLSPSDETLAVRQVIWRGAYDMFLEKPFFGWGEGSFQSVFPLFRSPGYQAAGVTSNTVHAHSEMMEVAAETGLLGLAVWGGLFILWIGAVLSRRRSWTTTDLAAVSGVVFIVVESFVSVSLRWSSTPFLLAVFAAVPLSGGTPEERFRLPRASVVFPIAGAALLLAFGTPTTFGMIRSSRHLYRAKTEFLDRVPAILADGVMDPATARDEALDACEMAMRECMLSIDLCDWEYASRFTLGNAALARASILGAGCSGAPADTAGARASLGFALDCYDSLSVMAPDFSDMRLNRLHALVMTGDYDGALAEAVYIHSRRAHLRDYCELLVHRIAPFTTGYRYDAFNTGVFLRTISRSDRSGSEGFDLRVRRAASGMLLALALCSHESAQAADTLASVYVASLDTLPEGIVALVRPAVQSELQLAAESRRILEDVNSGTDQSLQERCREVVENSPAFAPYHRYALCALSAESGDPGTGVLLGELSLALREFGWHRVLAWPGRGEHLVFGAMIALEGDSADMGLLEQLFDDALIIDNTLYSSLSFARQAYVLHHEPTRVDSVHDFWVGLGGPCASGVSGLRGALPLVGGGVLDRMYGIVDSMSSSHPDSTLLRVFLLRQRFRLGSRDIGVRPLPADRLEMLAFDPAMVRLIDMIATAHGSAGVVQGCCELLTRDIAFLYGLTRNSALESNSGAYRDVICTVLREAGGSR